jgi:hypothetical protein
MKNKWLKVSLIAVVGGVAAVIYTPRTEAGGAAKKVSVCHKGQTLEIPEAAVEAHLGHGDTLGPCTITPSKNQ